MKIKFLRPVMLFALLGFGCIAQAATINYSISGNGTGNLGSTRFKNADFTISLFGDTDQLVGNLFESMLSASISITGMGTADFLASTRLAFDDSTDVLSLSKLNTNKKDVVKSKNMFSFDLSDPDFDFVEEFAPLSGTGALVFGQFKNMATSMGKLRLKSASDTVVFSSVEVSAVPLPGAVWLFGSGLLAFFGVSKKKKAAITA